MTQPLRSLVALIALALLCGCSTHRMAEKTRLPLHPIYETRMTNRPSAGYVPTGVWRVQGAQNTVYFAGTCHVVAGSEVPFPSAYYAAYRDSKEVLVEVDSLSFSGTWMRLGAVPGIARFIIDHASEIRCPKGQTLASYLSPETMRQLREHYGEDLASRQRLTPLGLVFLSELGDSGTNAWAGVDDLFTLLAHRDGKHIRSLDGRAAARLLVPTLDAVLTQTRKEIASRGADAVVKESVFDERETRWRYGDMSTADEEIAEMKRDVPELYEKLLPGRNRQWLPSIRRALAGKRNVMVLVGALHLVGEDGLIEMLRREGFKMEQMYGIDRPDTSKVDVSSRSQQR